MAQLHDGQHRHGERRNCFFCLRWKSDCQIFRMNEGNEPVPPELESIYKGRFVVCPDCWDKGPEYLARNLLQWAKVQRMTERIMGGRLSNKRKRK